MSNMQELDAQQLEALNRMRAFEVGIATLCKESGFDYEALAKNAGKSSEELGMHLVDRLSASADAQQQTQGSAQPAK